MNSILKLLESVIACPSVDAATKFRARVLHGKVNGTFSFNKIFDRGW